MPTPVCFPSDHLIGVRAMLRQEPLLRWRYDLGRRRVLLVDSNRLVGDVVDTVRKPGIRTHIRELIDSGELVAFVPDVVIAEVPRALERELADNGMPLEALRAAWQELRERLVVVSSSETAALDDGTSHSALRTRDASDLPFMLVAQETGAKVFTKDRDLLELHPQDTIDDLGMLGERKHCTRSAAVGYGRLDAGVRDRRGTVVSAAVEQGFATALDEALQHARHRRRDTPDGPDDRRPVATPHRQCHDQNPPEQIDIIELPRPAEKSSCALPGTARSSPHVGLLLIVVGSETPRSCGGPRLSTRRDPESWSAWSAI